MDDSKTTPTLGCEASYHFVNGVQPTGEAVQCDAWQGTVWAVSKLPRVFSHGCVGIGEACRGTDRVRLRVVRQGTVGAVDK